MIKRFLIILVVVALYILSVSFAAMYLPFAPSWLKPLFVSSFHLTLAWMIFTHTIVVGVVGCLLALLLIRYDKENAQTDAFIVGILSILWGCGFRWKMGITWGLTWDEITDYLIIGLAVPALVAVLSKVLKTRARASNQALEPIR